MYCPFCNASDTKVTDSRLLQDGNQIRRRRECLICHERFTTYETARLTMPGIIKRDGRRDFFHEDKLRAGMLRALEKRPVARELVETAIQQIIRKAQSFTEPEISSMQIGEWVMDALRKLDDVAYVRFASVYRSFEDISAFLEEIRRIESKN